MPEGHTIHRLAKDVASDLRDRPVGASSPQGRFHDSAALIDGTVLTGTEAYGKNLFLEFGGHDLLFIHLGLIGKLRRHDLPHPERDTIRLRLEGQTHGWDLTGPQSCRILEPGDREEIVSKLGPDPLRRGAKPDGFLEKLERSGKPIGALLLDQGALAGVGNVYRSEFCFLTGINPHQAAKTLTLEQGTELWDLAKAQLRLGVKLNRIVTRVPAEVGLRAAKIGSDDRLYAYKREGLPCHRCGTEIVIATIANRSAWYCPTCQPKP